jgi:AraC-like DNA-binding protein
MSSSVMSVFGEPDDFQAALREDGIRNLLVTGQGEFRARLTQVTLHHLRLSAGDERLARIAFAAVPPNALLVLLPIGGGPWPIWGGAEMQPGEMITLGPGQRVHARTEEPCRWGAIRLPTDDLAQYARALRGEELGVPRVARWRPSRAALRQLRHFHQAAIRAVEARSTVFAHPEAAHGLEQQLVHALIECLAKGTMACEEPKSAARCRDMLAGFEDLLAEPLPRIAGIAAALGVSGRTLNKCCKQQLGMAASRYRDLRRLQQAQRASVGVKQ